MRQETSIVRIMRQGSFKPGQPLVDLCQRGFQLSLGSLARKDRVVDPPVHSHLLGFVYRANDQPNLDGEQLDVNKLDFDIAGDDNAFVEHTLENIGQRGTLQCMRNLRGHGASPLLEQFSQGA
jgi:hypothetical protein